MTKYLLYSFSSNSQQIQYITKRFYGLIFSLLTGQAIQQKMSLCQCLLAPYTSLVRQVSANLDLRTRQQIQQVRKCLSVCRLQDYQWRRHERPVWQSHQAVEALTARTLRQQCSILSKSLQAKIFELIAALSLPLSFYFFFVTLVWSQLATWRTPYSKKKKAVLMTRLSVRQT